MKRAYILIGIGLIFMFTFFLLFKQLNYHEYIEQSIPGVIINLKSGEVITDARLKVSGVSKRYLNRIFDGIFELQFDDENLDYLKIENSVKLNVREFGNNQITPLYTKNVDFRSFSTFFVDKQLKNFVIQLNDVDNISSDLFFISETNDKDAIKLSKELLKKSDFSDIY